MPASPGRCQKPLMTSNVDSPRQPWWLLALTLFTFLFLLGSRSLYEPDEGRYAEIAREMIETGDWLVPHFWYVPHLDKPPLTYWAVAVSILAFGENEWAVRLPLALSGLSGVWACCLFGRELGGRRVGLWSALILQSSLLYFVMARMLTSDIFLAQFIAWAVYFFWQSWRRLDHAAAAPESKRNGKRFFGWHLAGWTAVALGFLTKGPIALAVPLVCLAALLICRGREVQSRKALAGGLMAGLALFAVLVAPWFTTVFHRVPGASDFMIYGQAVGHVLGTTIRNRRGSPFYFFGILGIGLLPWTWLLCWLWRRAHWRSLAAAQKDGWLVLSVWAVFPFCLFSLTRAKLPAYILPIFPALSVMVALRFFGTGAGSNATQPPGWTWRLCMMSPLVLMVVIPVLVPSIFHVAEPASLKLQVAVAAVALALLGWRGRRFSRSQCAAFGVVLALLSLQFMAAGMPLLETSLNSNQTIKPLGLALRESWRPGDTLVCWGRLPQGLPFYAHPVLSVTRRPYLGGMAFDQVPFEFPGNRERFGGLVLPDEHALVQLLSENKRVLVVGFSGSLNHFQQVTQNKPLHQIIRVGQWELFSNH